MKIFFPKGHCPSDKRVCVTPDSTAKLIKIGLKVVVESGIAQDIHISDRLYEKAGATIVHSDEEGYQQCQAVLSLQTPTPEQLEKCKKGSLWIGKCDPFQNPNIAQSFANHGIDAICMEWIPRSTIAQKMDLLSSQASLAGYVAVLKGMEHSDKSLPMMNTPAGTIKPARVLIIGAGVAGLQAIATAKRLGARVDAYDTRDNVKEQIESLGAKAVSLDLGATSQTKDGYAKALTPEQLEKQKQALAAVCSQMDIVITTAQVFGKKAPIIITDPMVQQMKEGAVIVDLAVETGGNTEGVSLDQVVKSHGVSIVGFSHLSNEVAIDASQMAASNYANFLTHFWNKDEKCLHLDPEDEIIQSASLTKNGSIIHPNIQGFIQHEDENKNLNDENENLNDENENENINNSGEQTCLTK